MTISIDVISDSSKMNNIEVVWNKYINLYSENPFFLSHFIKKFMEFNCSKKWTPLILIISADKMIVGIVPLITKRKFGIRFVKFLYEFYFSPDFIFNDQYRETCIEHTIDFLFKTLRCQFVELTLPADSPNLQILKKNCKTNRIYFRSELGWKRRIIPIDCTWEEYKKSKGSKFRKEFRYIERRLDRAGPWKIICVENEDRGSDTIKKILDVERMSWKEAWRTRRGLDRDQDLLMIWEGSQFTVGAVPDFKWSVWFLELNDQTLAYILFLQYKEEVFLVKTSYNEQYRNFSPSKYLWYAAIRELFNERKVRNIDFLTDLPFLRIWTSKSLPRVRIVITKGVLLTIIGAMLTIPYRSNLFRKIGSFVRATIRLG